MTSDLGFEGIVDPKKGIFHWQPHYELIVLDSLDDVKQIFGDGETINYELNWCFLSMSGVHGSYTTLDDLERYWDLSPDDDEYRGHSITVSLLHPRLCVLRYGHLEITKEDIPYLRDLVTKTMAGVATSQNGNLQSLHRKASE